MTNPATVSTISTRRFTLADQHWFGRTSGDVNPMHVDPIQARRTLYGQPVVHGVHVILWALDAWCVQQQRPITRLNVTFSKPVFLDEDVEVRLRGTDDQSSQLVITVEDTVVMTVRIDHTATTDERSHPGVVDSVLVASPPSAAHRTSPADLSVEELIELRGAVAAPGIIDDWTTAFARLSAVVGGSTVGELASLSTVVGMECPGLHSVFAGFDVGLDARPVPDATDIADTLFEVQRANTRFFAVKIAARSARVTGELSAFVRPRPTEQPAMAEVIALVDPNEFVGLSALIVGGSRGLGEVTAKLIAAGGGSPTISWHRGRGDAEAVARDIESAGRRVELVQLDVNSALDADAATNGHTHLFYFASPRITSRRLVSFDRDSFDKFCGAYIDGFVRIANRLVASGSTNLHAFYPSSVYVDDVAPDMVEYAAAKAAGEVVARQWAASLRGPSVHVERLRPLSTDQTAGVMRTETDDAATAMLAVLRRMSGDHTDHRGEST